MPKFYGEYVCAECGTSFEWKATPRKKKGDGVSILVNSSFCENVVDCYKNDYGDGYVIVIHCPNCHTPYYPRKYKEEE